MELKPCKCGNKELDYFTAGAGSRIRIQCPKCKATSKFCIGITLAEMDWNRRVGEGEKK